jgi:hypothetical protein
MEAIHRIVGEFHKARLLCPTYGAIYCVVGQLEKIVLNDPVGTEHIRKGFELAPCDPTACFVAALLDIEEEKIDAAINKLNRAVELDDGQVRWRCELERLLDELSALPPEGIEENRAP